MAQVAARSESQLVGGRYRLERQVGKGGMGTVFEVVDESTGRTLALKQLGGKSVQEVSESAKVRFRREFHTMAGLRHPRIVRVFDYAVDPSFGPYYTMELLDGSDLRDVGGITPDEVCRHLRDVAAALAFLHARGLVHRDLAPQNIRCTAGGDTKLIDFGVLATVGVADDVAGTPPFIAPENLRGLPLDHRADLFGLGALAYWMLTGRHAYPARAVRELEVVWRQPVAPPSTLAEGISDGLDELVMSLLCLDRLGRPVSAAEVIDRLSAIANLGRDEAIEVRQGYLNSAALVGRSGEMRMLRRAAVAAVEGTGGMVLIEAPSGTGKTRLLREAGLEAQLAGGTVVSASSEAAGRGPYGLIRELIRGLLEVAPEEALAPVFVAESSLPRLFPELRERLGDVPIADVVGDAAEQRLRAQRDLQRWFLHIARRRALVLLVDDVQRCDEASAAALAVLSRVAFSESLLLCVALRTDEDVRAPMQVAAMRDAGDRLRLRGLDEAAVQELVQSLFGDVPHASRLARWIHGATNGSPLHCLELAHHLVDTGAVRYADGEWVIPPEVHEAPAPASLAASMDARIGQLGEPALELSTPMAVHGGTIPLERALQLGHADERATFAALDELVRNGVLVGTGDSYRFRHDGLREAVLRRIEDAQLGPLHLRVAESLLSDGSIPPDREAEIGWHLYDGGEVDRGAKLLERAGRRLFEGQALRDCLPPLEVAIDGYARRGAPLGSYVELRTMLLSAAFYSDRQVAWRHARPTVVDLRAHAGVALAARLRRYLGKHVAFVVSFIVTWLRWLVVGKWRRHPGPIESLMSFLMASGYACSLSYAHSRAEELDEFIELVGPLAVFENRNIYAGYLGCSAFRDMQHGHYRAAKRKFERSLHVMETDRLTPVPDYLRRAGEGGMRGVTAFVQVFELDNRLEENLAAMEKLDLRYYDMAVEATRATDLRMRGFEAKARRIEEQIESLALQLGTWSIDMQLLSFSVPAYSVCRDIIGLKRAMEGCDRLRGEGLDFPETIAFIKGEYHRERGELEEARRVVEQGIAACRQPVKEQAMMYLTMSLADTLLALGELDEAVATAEGTLQRAHRVEDAVLPRLRSVRTIALVEASRGEHDAAAARLDESIDEAVEIGAPSVEGMLREARARTALLAGDRSGFKKHAAAAAHCVKPTANPALIAMSERLQELGAARQTYSVADARDIVGETVTTANRAWTASAVLERCRGPAERAAKALELLVEVTGAKSGYLYLCQPDEGMTLAAPLYGRAPTPQMVNALKEVMAGLGDVGLDVEATVTTTSPPTVVEGRSHSSWRPFPLRLDLDRERAEVVGVVILVEGATAMRAPDGDLVQDLALALYRAGDVTHVETE